MDVFVQHLDPQGEFDHEEGCRILELYNRADDPMVSIARARVPPESTTKKHVWSDVVERYVILEGKGQVEVGEVQEEVGPGDVVVIPAGCPQRIRNTGDGDLVFLAVCTPRFRPDVYQDLEK